MMQKNLYWLILPLIGLLGCSKAGAPTVENIFTAQPAQNAAAASIEQSAAAPSAGQAVASLPDEKSIAAPPAKQAVAAPPAKQAVAAPPTKQALAAPSAEPAAKAESDEKLSVKSTRLKAGIITLAVRMDPAIRIAQIQVDGAYREFSQASEGPGKVRIVIPYPWVNGEVHHVAILTSRGAIFEHDVDAGRKL